MDKTKLDTLKTAALGATKGKRVVVGSSVFIEDQYLAEGGNAVTLVSLSANRGVEQREKDLNFFAAADPDTVLELIATLKKVEDENTFIRAGAAQGLGDCLHCGLSRDDWSQCRDGFPGCARADDAINCPHLGAFLDLDKMRLWFTVAATGAALFGAGTVVLGMLVLSW